VIARLRVLLPFFFSVREGDDLPPLHCSSGEYQIKIYPPLQTAVDFRSVIGLSAIPLNELVTKLVPTDPPSKTDLITVDRKPAVQANLLQIDFVKPEFDRRHVNTASHGEFEASGDPPIRLCFEVANNFLQDLRTLTRGSQVRTITHRSTVWRLDYFADDGTELAQEEGKYRRRVGAHISLAATAIAEGIWHQARELSIDYRPPTWDTLLLDAEALLPELGASIVLAFAALETFISWVLDNLAQRSELKPELWQWINDRENWLKEPSVTERYNQLLRIFTNKSLKDQPELWESFKKLNTIRDTFAHTGKLELGGEEVTVEDAYKMIGRSKEIIDWLESTLVEELRRPKLQRPVEVGITKLLFGPSGA